jgi:type 1 glutamine amidotransferase
MGDFHPNFSDYKVIISNYNGEPWSAATEEAFVKFVQEGGGFVSVHAADNSFPQWKAYNEMIAVGGWNNRNEKSGPYLRLRNGVFEQDMTPGVGGSHGKQHAFRMEARAPEHPIMAGLPAQWMHAKDELYDRLRGPARNVTVLATAFSPKEQNGSGENEPLLMTISYGKGRVFHTALGHNNGKDLTAQKCVGFITTLQRGVEWAATGAVTQKVPADFPTAEKVSLRE